MKKQTAAVLFILAVGTLAGCGSSGSGTASTTVSGTVADGYLANATVFLDKNGNYQLDAGEPSTTSDSNGAYSLTIAHADAGKHPVVACAIAGTTIDRDSNTAVANSYVLCAPAGTTEFISPMSTLVREKLAANPGMTMTEAMTQLRNQMNLPSDIDVMTDYVAGSQPGMNAAHYQKMHGVARQMVGLMAGQAAQVMTGSSVNANRYRGMMATINANMSGIAANVDQGLGMNSEFMTNMMSTMQSQMGEIPMTGGFMNYSAMFRNMTSNRYFWDHTPGTATPMTPMRGGMM